ncbi:sensor histidine kinase [Streptomyces purpureus]|uniref:sensor histidine kinase n=1 Tax=Streptomyces purpureus TaxID=1951 RepID=UPI0003605CCD|nr:sensor histidine kinase [Streptomyces purpureus]
MTTETTKGAPDQEWTAGAPPLSQYIQRKVQHVRAVDRRRPWLWDTLLTLFWTFAALVDASGGWRNLARDQSVPVWLVVSMSLAFSVPLLWRRRHPMTVLTLMAATAVVNTWSGAFLQANFLQAVIVFNIALHLPLRTLLWTIAPITLPLVIGAARHPQGSWDQQVVPTIWAYAMVALLAVAVRSRQDYTAALVERARRLEVERDQQAQLAAAAERTRIAREMHDIIGHHLSVITGLADGGSYAAAKSPERAAQALGAIGTTSRQALDELRRLLGVLRDQPPEAVRAPQPTLDDLASLIDGVRTAGLPVRHHVHAPAGPAPLSAGRQLTVYRIVQEALTNTLKHGGPAATAEVALSYGEGQLEVVVTDTGRRTDVDDSTGTGPGQGLAGMRERTWLYDGTLEAGPLPTGGWRVHLRLPLEDTPS